jgi:hypothetical protein
MLLALSVPADNDRGPLYMDQALAAIHQANPHRQPIALILTSLAGTIRLLCRFPDELRAAIESQLYAQYPDCRLEFVPEEALQQPSGTVACTTELHLHRFLFPIKRYTQFEDALNRTSADPLTALLTTLIADRKQPTTGRIEITVRPARTRIRHRAEQCLRRLNRGFFRSHHRLAHWYVSLALSPHWPPRLCGWLLGRLAHKEPAHSATDPLHTSASRLHEREADLQAAADKLGRLLFQVHIRLIVMAPPDRHDAATRKLREMAGAFGQFSVPRLATFYAGPAKSRRQQRLRWSRGFLLSTEELATLFHPPTATVRAPALRTVESRELAPPISLPLPGMADDLAILGSTIFRGRSQRFGLLPEDRFRHVAVLGKTGMGKSTLLQQLIASDIRAGRGVAVIDPHGDLVESILASVPRHRTNDVILFDAGDRDHPLSFNVFACRDAHQRPLVASGVVAAFKKLYADSWGPRLEHVLRNCVLALLEVPGTTLISVVRLLANPAYRKGIVGRITDPVVRSFWEHEFASLHPKLQIEAIAPIQNKIGHFVSSPLLRNIVGQAHSRLDLREVMDQGKVLLVSLSKGRIGEDASALLGAFLTTAIQLAAMSRADQPEAERRSFFLYVDEFQNYATEAFATILSEARKYRLALTVANQYLAQLDEPTLHALFGNVGSLVCFQLGAKDAELLAEQLGGDILIPDLLQVPRYGAYVRLLIDGQPSRPFSMQTLPPPVMRRFDPHRMDIIRRSSRRRYARPADQVEAEIRHAIIQP